LAFTEHPYLPALEEAEVEDREGNRLVKEGAKFGKAGDVARPYFSPSKV
jgi:hypothetical protein